MFTCLNLKKKVSPFLLVSEIRDVQILVSESTGKVFTASKALGEKCKLLLGGTSPTSHLITQFRFLQSLSTNLPLSSNFGEVGERGAVINYTLPNKTQVHQSIIRWLENQEKVYSHSSGLIEDEDRHKKPCWSLKYQGLLIRIKIKQKKSLVCVSSWSPKQSTGIIMHNVPVRFCFIWRLSTRRWPPVELWGTAPKRWGGRRGCRHVGDIETVQSGHTVEGC